MDCTLMTETRQTYRVSDECRVKIEHEKQVRKNSINVDIQLIEMTTAMVNRDKTSGMDRNDRQNACVCSTHF